MQSDVSGEITVFLALLLSGISAFLWMVFLSGADVGARTVMETSFHRTMYSCFGEYNIDMFKRYKLFAVDTSYLGNQADTENLSKRVVFYMNRNLVPEDGKADLLKVSVTDAQLTKWGLLSDDDGYGAFEQAVYYEYKYCDYAHADLLRDMGSEMARRENAYEYYGAWDEALAVIASSGLVLSNPSAAVRAFSTVAADCALENVQSSCITANVSGLYTHRGAETGKGSKVGRIGKSLGISSDRMWDLFIEYLYNVCGCFYRECDSVLTCESGYLLFGSDSDTENAEYCANEIMNVFFVQNADYLRNEKWGEIMLMAEGATGIYLNPALTEAYAQALLYGWAFSEAYTQTRSLYNGNGVDLWNVSGRWKSLITQMEETVLEGDGSSGGEKLPEYVCALLSDSDHRSIQRRFIDLVEMNIQHGGSPGFRADAAVVYADIKVVGESGYKRTYEIQREYGYETP